MDKTVKKTNMKLNFSNGNLAKNQKTSVIKDNPSFSSFRDKIPEKISKIGNLRKRVFDPLKNKRRLSAVRIDHKNLKDSSIHSLRIFHNRTMPHPQCITDIQWHIINLLTIPTTLMTQLVILQLHFQTLNHHNLRIKKFETTQ